MPWYGLTNMPGAIEGRAVLIVVNVLGRGCTAKSFPWTDLAKCEMRKVEAKGAARMPAMSRALVSAPWPSPSTNHRILRYEYVAFVTFTFYH